MKRIQRRKKYFRVNSPVGASLLCLTALLILALLYTGIAWLVKNSAALAESAKEALLQATATQAPSPSPAPTQALPSLDPVLTPDLGTPEPPATPDPDNTDDPNGDTKPPVNPDSPLYGITIGIDPYRDKGSQYKAEAEYNLAFAKKLAAYLESMGATVVLTRENNSKTYSDAARAKVIKDAKCDYAIRLLCNHLSKKKTDGTWVQTVKKYKSFAQDLADCYSAATGIGKRYTDGVEVKNLDFLNATGCPSVQLVLGHWTNSAELKKLKDADFQDKMIEGIFNAILKQVNP